MSQQWKIEGKTFLVTGGASGLGAGFVEAFLKEGAKNAVILDVDEKTGRATTDRLNETYNGKAIFIKCDVSDEDSLTKAFNEVVDKFKQVDVIINNAGILNDSPEVWRTSCIVNWVGLVSLTMRGVKHMRKDEGGAGGTIINISSVAALFTLPTLPIYSGSKSAVLHFSRCLSADPFYEQTGIRIVTFCPGVTDTPLLDRAKDSGYTKAHGEGFVEFVKKEGRQKVETVVSACVEMYRKGDNGSAWVTIYDRPAKDISKVLDDAFAVIDKVLQSE